MNKQSFRNLFFIFSLIFLITACATKPLETIDYDVSESKGIFTPVQLFINRNTPVPRFYVSRINAIEKSLKESHAFLDIGTHIDSPYILDIELHRGTYDTAVDFAGQLLSAATLFVVPSKVKNYNTLSVDLYAYGKKIKSYTYKEDYESSLSIFSLNEVETDKDEEFRSIKNLINTFLKELDNDGLIEQFIEKEVPIENTKTITTVPPDPNKTSS